MGLHLGGKATCWMRQLGVSKAFNPLWSRCFTGSLLVSNGLYSCYQKKLDIRQSHWKKVFSRYLSPRTAILDTLQLFFSQVCSLGPVSRFREAAGRCCSRALGAFWRSIAGAMSCWGSLLYRRQPQRPKRVQWGTPKTTEGHQNLVPPKPEMQPSAVMDPQ